MSSFISTLHPLATLLAGTQALTYDYVVVGGGTSGLTVANRLSEIANISVAVIEAGSSVLDNVNVTDVSGYGNSLGTDIDWAYETVPQTYASNTVQTMSSGKAVGGTSTINGKKHYTSRQTEHSIDILGRNGICSCRD